MDIAAMVNLVPQIIRCTVVKMLMIVKAIPLYTVPIWFRRHHVGADVYGSCGLVVHWTILRVIILFGSAVIFVEAILGSEWLRKGEVGVNHRDYLLLCF